MEYFQWAENHWSLVAFGLVVVVCTVLVIQSALNSKAE
jgi:hypothetical protein